MFMSIIVNSLYRGSFDFFVSKILSPQKLFLVASQNSRRERNWFGLVTRMCFDVNETFLYTRQIVCNILQAVWLGERFSCWIRGSSESPNITICVYVLLVILFFTLVIHAFLNMETTQIITRTIYVTISAIGIQISFPGRVTLLLGSVRFLGDLGDFLDEFLVNFFFVYMFLIFGEAKITRTKFLMLCRCTFTLWFTVPFPHLEELILSYVRSFYRYRIISGEFIEYYASLISLVSLVDISPENFDRHEYPIPA